MFPLLWMAMASLASAWTADLDPQRWFVVNDTVMGGVSQSEVGTGPHGGLVFRGALSLENNGGFTSTRTRVQDPDWSEASALRLSLRGDGRTYLCTLRLIDERMQSIYYRAEFATRQTGLTEVEIPFSDFDAYVFGQRVPQAPPLYAVRDRVGSVGVMLADKTPGAFALEIEALETSADPSLSEGKDVTNHAVVSTTFLEAIRGGVPLFNSGQVERCADLYAAAIRRVVALPDPMLDASSRAVLASSLERGATEADGVARAWVYRHAIDWVLARSGM